MYTNIEFKLLKIAICIDKNHIFIVNKISNFVDNLRYIVDHNISIIYMYTFKDILGTKCYIIDLIIRYK